MISMSTPADLLPESEEIEDLLGSINGQAKPAPGRRIVLGSNALGQFLASMNWRNEEGRKPHASAVDGPAHAPRLGAMKLGQVLAGINWRNRPETAGQLGSPMGAATDHARMVVDGFMAEIAWD